MTWILCFFFCIGGLNSIVIYYLLKKAGVEAENFLLGGILSLFSVMTLPQKIILKYLTKGVMMFKQNVETKKIVVQGKKGSYSIPAKVLNSPLQPRQESLWKEYWT